MDFKSLSNIESSFKQIRLIAFTAVILSAIVSLFSVGYCLYFMEKQREKIYVLEGGKSLMMALSQDLSQNRPAEAHEHVKRFHEYFFTLPPNKEAIETNIEAALCLADRSVYKYYNDLKVKRYYDRLITNNMNQIIKIDSISCDLSLYPYDVKTYAKQIIIRESIITERNLITRSKMIDTKRSDTNPQGFILENFEVIDNTLLNEYER